MQARRLLFIAVAAGLMGCAMTPVPQEAVAASASPGVATSASPGVAALPSVPPPVTPEPGATIAPFPADWPSPCPGSGQGYVAGQLLVAFTDAASEADHAAFKTQFNILAERPMALSKTWVMRVACDADINALAKTMSAAPGVRYAEADAIIQLDDPVVR